MRGWMIYSLTVLLVSFLACCVVYILPADNQFVRTIFPVPVLFALPKNNQVTTLDVWTIPTHIADTNNTSLPAISAESFITYDLTTSSILFAKNATDSLPMASLTKVMTAVVSLEHPKPDDSYTVSDTALVGEDSMGLSSGERLSLSDLLYGLMLHSGNDAAETLAENFTGGRSAFVEAMNTKAMTIGMNTTHYTNPTGLEGDGNQHTTVRDLLIVTRYGLVHFPLFRDVVATFDYTIPEADTHKAYYLENETNLITSYPGVKGVKTGYTPEAGLCLVTYLDYGGHQIIGVVLHSSDRRNDMKDLLDASLKKLGITPARHG